MRHMRARSEEDAVSSAFANDRPEEFGGHQEPVRPFLK